MVKLSRLHTTSPQRVAENWKSPYFMEIFQCQVDIFAMFVSQRLEDLPIHLASNCRLPRRSFHTSIFSCSVAVIMSDDPICWNHPGADNPTGSNTPKSLPYPKPSLYKTQSFFQHTRFPNKHTLDFRLPEFFPWITTAQQKKKAQQKTPFAIRQSNAPHLFCGSTQQQNQPPAFLVDTTPKKSA